MTHFDDESFCGFFPNAGDFAQKPYICRSDRSLESADFHMADDCKSCLGANSRERDECFKKIPFFFF